MPPFLLCGMRGHTRLAGVSGQAASHQAWHRAGHTARVGKGCDDFKKKMHHVRVKFYWGQYEDRSPADNPSDSSERLLRRGRRKVSLYAMLDTGERMKSGVCFLGRKFLLVSWSFCSGGAVVTMKDFRGFLDMRAYRSRAHNISL